jgi:AraC-like DNA-binding protein
MNSTLLSIIYFIACSHAVMLAAALWLRTEKARPGRVLSILTAILAYKLFEGGSLYSGLYQYVPHLLDLMPAMVMVLGPIFYGYVRQVTGQPALSWQQWLLHLAPWLAVWFFLNSPSVFRAADLKIEMWQAIANAGGSYRKLPIDIVFRLLAIKAHLTVYLYLSWRSLSQFTIAVENLRSDNSRNLVKHLKLLAMAFIILEATWVSLFIGNQYFDIGTLNQVSEIWLLFIAVIILAMGFTGLQQPNMIFTQEERLLTSVESSHNNAADGEEKVKYIHSALPDSTANEIAKQIEKLMSSQQLFLNDKLTLTELAKALEMKSHTISQVINQQMKTNFYKLVNGYRVQHAADLLENDQINWSIERIALESGFSNRVTFNKAFKEQMRCTASAYKKQHNRVSLHS